MTTRGLHGLIAVLAAGSLCTAAAGQLVFDGALLDSAGRVERAGIASMRMSAGAAGEMTVIDARGTSRTRPLGEAIALVPGTWAESQPSPGAAAVDAWTLAGAPFVELVDGQRFGGRPGRIGADGETIAWVHERFGTLMLPIDEVARFVMRPGADLTAAGSAGALKSDTVWLVNGDRLEGFLETVGPRVGGEGFTLTIETGGNRVTVPVDQVVRAQFSNPRHASRGAVAWLADGSVVALAAIATETDKAVLSLTASAAKSNGGGTAESPGATATAQFSSHDVSAIAFDASRVAALAGLEIVGHRAIGLPRRPGPRIDAVDAVPVPLGAADVLLPGPMEVEWAVPAGATRLIGTARLDEADWTWGECAVVVALLSGTGPARELVRVSLGGPSVASPLATDLGGTKSGDRLRVRVEPGELGPIRDRVRLERVLLLR